MKKKASKKAPSKKRNTLPKGFSIKAYVPTAEAKILERVQDAKPDAESVKVLLNFANGGKPIAVEFSRDEIDDARNIVATIRAKLNAAGVEATTLGCGTALIR